ncbi:MAG: hypothetical protein ACUVQP_00155 [Bacteroidales bacterium]
MNFLEGVLKVTEHLESPTSYLEWAAYVSIAAVLRDNVYIKRGPFAKIYPNLYVIIVGDSGATRKSSPLRVVNRLVKPVQNTKIIEGRASIQGVLNRLSEVVTLDNGRTLRDGSALLYSEEFAAFLVKDPQTTAILTDIYDFKEEHDIVLKTQSIVRLKNVCITMFAATNAVFLQDLFTKQDLYGGLVGRTIFIIEEKARKKDTGFDDETPEEEITSLVNHLHKISRIKGELSLTKEAKKFFEDWYLNTDFSANESKTGFEHRMHTHVLKLATILAACESSFNKIIEKSHIETAIDKICSIAVNYKKLLAALNRSQYIQAQAVNEIMIVIINNFLRGKRQVKREELLRELFGKLDIESTDKGITMLEQAGLIKISGDVNTIYYEISQKGQEMFLSKIKSTSPPN